MIQRSQYRDLFVPGQGRRCAGLPPRLACMDRGQGLQVFGDMVDTFWHGSTFEFEAVPWPVLANAPLNEAFSVKQRRFQRSAFCMPVLGPSRCMNCKACPAQPCVRRARGWSSCPNAAYNKVWPGRTGLIF
jgi:hypothetical protein